MFVSKTTNTALLGKCWYYNYLIYKYLQAMWITYTAFKHPF